MNSKQIGINDCRKMAPLLKHANVNEMSDEQLKLLDRTLMLGKLCGAIVHELRQPLAAILSNAQTACRLLEKNSLNLGELQDIVNDIIADDKRAIELMYQLRAFFTKGTSHYETFDFNELVKESLNIIHGHLRIHHISLSQDLDPHLLLVHADRWQIQQVLLNLFLNAVEAMSTAALDHRELKLRSENKKNDIRFLISDTGSGIPVKVLERLFDPFFTTKDEGMGIGLSLSLAILAENGGSISASNNPDCGATFSLVLPISSCHLND